jgi:hypothetical protein
LRFAPNHDFSGFSGIHDVIIVLLVSVVVPRVVVK